MAEPGQLLVNLAFLSHAQRKWILTEQTHPRTACWNTTFTTKTYFCFPTENFIMIQNTIIAKVNKIKFEGNVPVMYRHRTNKLRNVNVFKAK